MDRLIDKVADRHRRRGRYRRRHGACAGREGAAVLVVDIDPAAAERTVGAIEDAGGKAMAFQADLSDEAQVVATIAATMAHFDRLHVLHNNAALDRLGVPRPATRR